MTSDETRVILAAIDIGSNSIKMSVARVDDGDQINQFDWASETVRLGHGLEKSGRLDEERIELALETLSGFEARARELGATRLVAVATEATRAAANGEEFLERVRNETGIEVRVIDGQEEAALTFRGVASSIDIPGSAVIVDIGGGSTEVITSEDGLMLTARSVPLGSGRLTDRFVVADPPGAGELEACEIEAGRSILGEEGSQGMQTGPGTRLIVVGGTGEFMARLVPDACKIDLEAIRGVLARLRTLTASELAAQIDIPEARARVLPAGIAIVAAIASRLNPDRVEISHSGIRTGLLLEVADAGRKVGKDCATEEAVSNDSVDAGSRKNERGSDQEPSVDDAAFRDTMKSLIAERWETVWRAIPIALEGADIEGVHDVRVASRRLRAAMDVAAPAFPGKWFRPLHRTAKEITGALGEVRDRDVLLEALQADRVKAPLTEQPGIDRLIARVERERVDARAELERYLGDLIDGPLAAEIERRFGASMAMQHASQPSSRDNQ